MSTGLIHHWLYDQFNENSSRKRQTMKNKICQSNFVFLIYFPVLQKLQSWLLPFLSFTRKPISFLHLLHVFTSLSSSFLSISKYSVSQIPFCPWKMFSRKYSLVEYLIPFKRHSMANQRRVKKQQSKVIKILF